MSREELTQKIVAAHGGTLSVQSEHDEGSVFTIRLPATDRLAAQ